MESETEASSILVIDDEVRIGRVLSRILAKEYEVTVHSDAREAVTALQSKAFDLIICDLRMPEISGVELYEIAIEADPAHAGKFLFLSGDLSGSEVEEFFERTGESRLAKPFELNELRERVSELLA